MKSNARHSTLTRTQTGMFTRNELAILGTPCSQIQEIAASLAALLSGKVNLAYIDAEHQRSPLPENDPLVQGFNTTLSDKIDFFRLDTKHRLFPYQHQQMLAGCDLAIVNGNHFEAHYQIAVIDPRKPLNKKLHKLTQVLMIIFTDGVSEIPEEVQQHLGNTALIPQYRISDRAAIAQQISHWLVQRKPPLYGLVLAGGKSERMQSDKAMLRYHEEAQYLHTLHLLKPYCECVWVSCRAEQVEQFATEATPLPDTFTGLGPMGGILSAFREAPNAAWLVLACDLPLLSLQTLQHLNQHRDTTKVATTFRSPHDEFPEPLITIWEPRAYSVLLHFLSLGYSCPRKALINSDVNILEAPLPHELTNANLPEEYKEIKLEIQKKSH
jgi:molybdopterin-guanine dinucleotide biosynthesis protein A